MPPHTMTTGHRPNRHHLGVLNQPTSKPTGKAGLELSMVLEMTLPTIPAPEPTPTPHQSCPTAAHLKITNPLPRRSQTLTHLNPQWRHRDHSRADSTSTTSRSTESTNTSNTRTPPRCNRTDIKSDIEASWIRRLWLIHRFQRGLNPNTRTSNPPQPHDSAQPHVPMPPHTMTTGHRPNRHHLGVLNQPTSKPTGKAGLELSMVLEMTLPTIPAPEPTPTPHQSCPTAAHLKITNPLPSPVPNPHTLEPAMAAPRPLPGRFHLHHEPVHRIDQHLQHANTPRCNRTDIKSDIEASWIRRLWLIHRFQRGLNPNTRTSNPPQPHDSAQPHVLPFERPVCLRVPAWCDRHRPGESRDRVGNLGTSKLLEAAPSASNLSGDVRSS